MDLGEQYCQPDLQQFIAGRTQFPAVPHNVNSPDILHSSLVQHREMFPGRFQPVPDRSVANMMLGQQVSEIQSGGAGQCGMVFLPQRLDLGSFDSCYLSKCGPADTAARQNQRVCGGGGGGFEEFEEGGDGGNTRWPRRETLGLLDIRTKMDFKFKETNLKGPLWDEVSRLLEEEHGYHRSGKKCREKFENLYKYYKKTKEGKAGRQDGKNYRFFNQLEALYGETSNPAPEAQATQTQIQKSYFLNDKDDNSQKPCENFIQSLDFDTGSSSSFEEDDDDDQEEEEEKEGKKRKRKKWKTEMKTYIETQIKKLIERQEEWLQSVLQILEKKENERISREEAWRSQELDLLERKHKFWADERAWIEARDMAILEALKKLTKEEVRVSSPEEIKNNTKKWLESEILTLIKLRTGMETMFFESGSKGNLWEEISKKMVSLGYDRSSTRCKEKWENINKYYWKTKNSNKKRKENSTTCPYFQHLDSLYSNNYSKQFELVLEQNVKEEAIGKELP